MHREYIVYIGAKFKVTNDDGRGHEVSIPVALISYNDGKDIIDFSILAWGCLAWQVKVDVLCCRVQNCRCHKEKGIPLSFAHL